MADNQAMDPTGPTDDHGRAAADDRDAARDREVEFLAGRFEEHRGRLRSVAYRMLGSPSEAEDAVQEAWLRLSRADTAGVANLGGWLTTVVGRICLDMLRSRTARREQPLEPDADGAATGAGPGGPAGAHRVPDPVVGPPEGQLDPECEALLADSVGLALLVVLDTLTPAERLAFVLHDTFAVPFDEIAAIIGRSPAAARQLASRARRRVRGAVPRPEPDLARQRAVVDAFLAAARGGDFEALLAVLDPDVVVRADRGGGRGARTVARDAVTYAPQADVVRPATVNGAAGVVAFADGRPLSVMAFTVVNGRVTEIDIVNDPDRLARLDLSHLVDAAGADGHDA